MQLLILGVIAIVIFILEEYLFTASRYFWVGGIVPVLWTVFFGVPCRGQCHELNGARVCFSNYCGHHSLCLLG
ncbi:hypothetical protein [Lactiplantibacillus plantarum]|uniref:hypothetical protein n=1 Tax=Lactiplantibacillus plantarum TaxID=1590 RepID=UPI0020149E69|nr:hypothetical protein [Lactiplantibacillus plantarum]UQK33654.1 hypothetical protein MKM38_11485 [Lactiplantibacillus plantarum]